jgi:hypothetical protein
MDGIGPRLLRRVENGIDVKIRFRRLRRANVYGLIRHPYGERIRIRKAMDLHGSNTELPRGANDTHCDLAAICDEELRNPHG